MAVTIRDVAQEAGLSIATISKYLNHGPVKKKNEIRIRAAIEKLNYTPNTIAQGLKTSKTKMIGVIIPSVMNMFSDNVISAMEAELSNYNYGILFTFCNNQPETEVLRTQFLIDKMVDGVVTIPFSYSPDHLNLLAQHKIPFVVIDQKSETINCDTIIVDNVDASYSAVEALVQRGHKKIGIICGTEERFTTQERLEGYLKVLGDYAIPVRQEYICFGDYMVEGGYQAVKQLWDLEDKPTALFVTNYDMTLGAITAINELDIQIGKDLSVIGFDNMDLSKIIKPNLSIVSQPLEEIGRLAAHLILKRVNNDYSDFPCSARLKTHLELTNSVRNMLSDETMQV